MKSRIAAAGLVGLGMSAGAAAQVVPDGTLGTNVSQAGQTYTISGGTIAGGQNQFHSFQQFDLANLQIADFTGPAGIQNILSRVTGTTASTINGTIRSSIDGANLWIINPNGVVFGVGSALDVSGSLHVSTADYLLLEGGGRFFADPGGNFDPVLLVGNPTTFGFLDTPSPCIAANCVIAVNSATLEVPAGQSMTFVADEVRVESATLRAPQGRLNLASVGSAGEITLLPDGIDNSAMTYAGVERVSMTGQSTLDVSGAGGSIYIRGGSFLFGFDEADDESILAVNSEAADAGVIDIDVADRIHLQGEIRTDTSGAGNGADISMSAREFGDSVRDGGIAGNTDIVTASSGSGDAGSIFLNAEIFDLNADISTATAGSGKAGSINIDTTGNSLSLNVGSIETGTSGSGRGGDINITTTGDVFFGDGQFRTATTGTGDAGNITLTARNIGNAQNFSMTSDTTGTMADAGSGGNITFTATSGIDLSTATLSSSTSSSGAAGTVRLEAPTIVLTRNSAFPEGFTINTDSMGAGNGGNIELAGTDIEIGTDVFLTATAAAEGAAGTITIDAANAFAIGIGNQGSSIVTSTTGTGAAGNIDIRSAGLVDITRDAQIRSESRNATAGSAGSISIAGSIVQIHDTAQDRPDRPAAVSVQTASDRTDNLPGSISISATERIDISHAACCPTALLATTSGASDGGDITITAPVVAIDDSRIRVATDAAGNGGSVSVTGSTSLDLFGAIFEAGTRGTGRGGDIVLAGGDVTIDGATDLLANTFTAAQAGNIDVSGSNVRVQRAFVEASGGFEGTGGNVRFDATDQLTVGGTAQIIATTLGSGAGGNVSMDAAALTITDDASISVETTGTGNGGTITLSGGNVLVDGQATVSGVTSGAGAGGDIAISGGNVTAAGSSRIEASTSADGAGGGITMAADTISLGEDSELSVTTSGPGNGGTITLSGANVLVDGRATVSGVTSGAGAGGNVLIDAGDLRVQGNAALSAGSVGPGAGGDIAITGGNLTTAGSSRVEASTSADGAGGGITMDADTINLVEDSELSVTTSGSGIGGGATLDAANVTIEDRASVNASTTGAGNGGTVRVSADELRVQGGGSITASTSGAGNGGNILLRGDTLNVTDAASISATTTATGSGGNIDVSGGTVTLAAGGEITASSSGAGAGGSISMTPTELVLDPGGRIAVSASAAGDAGTVVIDAGESMQMNDAVIESVSVQSNGGDVVVSAGDLMYLDDSSVTTSADSISGNAGDIRLGTDADPAQPAFLIMQGSTIQANAGATGGAINIHSQYLLGGENVIEAISDTGNDGEIVFDVPATDFVSVLSQLDAPILNVSELLQDQCAASALKERSSFVADVVALPPSPEGYLSGGYYLPAAIATTSGRYRSGPPALAVLMRSGGC